MNELLTILREGPEPLGRLYEAILMRIDGHRLSLREYISYQLHTDQMLAAEERKRFIGEDRKWRLHIRCNKKQWFMLGEKLPMTLFMMATAPPMPKIHAVYDLDGRNLPGAITLNNIDETAAYLRTPQHYPLFVKPSRSAYGWGALGLQNYLPESDSIVFLNGKQRNVMEWIKSLNPKFSHGILFQEQLKPHPEIARVCGPRVSSIRSHFCPN